MMYQSEDNGPIVIQQLFTLDEARRALPLVKRIAEDIRTTVRDLSRINGGIAVLAGAMPVDEISAASQDAVRELLDRFASLTAELHEIGVELKGFDPVLVDFRSLRNGQMVNLCWAIDEDDIQYWHTLESGISGRQEL